MTIKNLRKRNKFIAWFTYIDNASLSSNARDILMFIIKNILLLGSVITHFFSYCKSRTLLNIRTNYFFPYLRNMEGEGCFVSYIFNKVELLVIRVIEKQRRKSLSIQGIKYIIISAWMCNPPFPWTISLWIYTRWRKTKKS